MARDYSHLRRGGPGRPKGAKNKKTLERDAMQWAQQFFKSDEYLQNARQRIVRGRAAHLESYWLPRIHGKEPDPHATVDVNWTFRCLGEK